MKVELLKFMRTRVSWGGIIFSVAGINWNTDELLLLDDIGSSWVHFSEVTLVENGEDEE